MTIEKITEGSTLTICLGGRLDTSTSPELDEVIKESVSDITNLIIDLKDLDYISSAGLRVILSAQKTMNGKKGEMLVKNANENVKEVFALTGFDSIVKLD